MPDKSRVVFTDFLCVTFLFALAACGGLSAKQKSAAKDAISSLRKIEAATQVGVNYQTYNTLLIEAKAKVNEAESLLPEGELKKTIGSCMDAYADASQKWNAKIQSRTKADDTMQALWLEAQIHLERASTILDQGGVGSTETISSAEDDKKEERRIAELEELPEKKSQRRVEQADVINQLSQAIEQKNRNTAAVPANESDYAALLDEVRSDRNVLEEISSLMQESDIFDVLWRLKVSRAFQILTSRGKKLAGVSPPSRYLKTHRDLLNAYKHFVTCAYVYDEYVDSREIDKAQQAADEMEQAGKFVSSAARHLPKN